MTLNKARIIANDYLAKYGLLEQGWTFELNNKKKRFGLTKFSTKTISLSKELTELNSPYEVVDTILHEIAHALVGKSNGHNNVWKSKAQEIGCNGSRVYSSKLVKQPAYKFVGTCPNCGKISKTYKRGKYACGACCRTYNGGKFKKEYLIVWERASP